jgi:hypothetical protein
VLSKSRIIKFLKRDCGTIPVAEIASGKIEIFSKHQRFLIATESSKCYAEYECQLKLYDQNIICNSHFPNNFLVYKYNVVVYPLIN